MNDGSAFTILDISEPEPGRQQVGEAVAVLRLVNMLQEVRVHRVGIHALKRDDEVRREPAIGLDREEGRQLSLDIL